MAKVKQHCRHDQVARARDGAGVPWAFFAASLHMQQEIPRDELQIIMDKPSGYATQEYQAWRRACRKYHIDVAALGRTEAQRVYEALRRAQAELVDCRSRRDMLESELSRMRRELAVSLVKKLR